MDEFQTILFKILTNANSAICLLGAIMLFIRGKNNRARRMLGYTLVLWGICSVVRTVMLEKGTLMSLVSMPMRPVGLIGGNIFLVLLLFYPLEVLLPGWLNLKRLFALFLPNILLTAIYVGILTATNQTVTNLTHITDFFTYFGQFNVWFRLTYLILILLYLIFLMKLIYHNEIRYIQWRNDNYSDVDDMDISWMRFYAYFLTLIFTAWLLNVLIANPWNYILHTTISIIAFSYSLYKALFYESAYPEDFFKSTSSNPLNITAVAIAQDDTLDLSKTSKKIEDNSSFTEKIPLYVETLEKWMDKEKPYLHKDFKLTDISKILPLNRSYLSRVLNEGLGMNFCQVVRKYRIETAKRLLKDFPELPLHQVAEQSGFSSNSIFIKAFQQEMHTTPTHYRQGH